MSYFNRITITFKGSKHKGNQFNFYVNLGQSISFTDPFSALRNSYLVPILDPGDSQ